MSIPVSMVLAERVAEQMNPEQLVTSLELSKRLKEASFPQGDSYFVWLEILKNEWEIFVDKNLDPRDRPASIAAPTIGELGEALPVGVQYSRYINGYQAKYDRYEMSIFDKRPVDPLAKMYLYLKTNGYLEVPDG